MLTVRLCARPSRWIQGCRSVGVPRAGCYAGAMALYELPGRRRSVSIRIAVLFLLLLVLLSARTIASYAIEIAWWKELGQLGTWFSMLYYSIAPVAAATLLAFGVLWLAHARALKFAGTGLGEHRLYARISTLVLLFVGWMVAASAIDTWTVVRFAGSRGLPAAATALARRGLRQAALLLPVRPAVLPNGARLRDRACDRRHRALLDVGARLATALPPAGAARRARNRSGPFPTGGRPGIALPARRRRGGAAGPGAALLLRPLRDGLQRARHLHGGDRLCGPEHRPAAAMAADPGLHRRRGAGVDGPLVAGRQHGDRAGRHLRGPATGVGPVRPPQRDFAGAAVHRDPHPRHAQRLRPGAERSRRWNSRRSRMRPSMSRPTSRCWTTSGSGTGARSTTPSPRSRRCAPTTCFTTPTWTVTPSTASTGRCCSRRANSTSASCPPRAPTGSTRPSSTRTATAWCWRR